MLTAVSAVAADMWRWRDADGVMHYSDRPVPGAERMNMQAPQSSGETSSGQNASSAAFTAPRPDAAAPPPIRYTRCEIQRPANDEVFNAVDTVTVTVALEPGLVEGYRLQMFVNGAEYKDWPAGSTTYSLQNLFRGSYSVSARVVSADGKAACMGPPVSFHIRQPTINSPARRPAPAPRGG